MASQTLVRSLGNSEQNVAELFLEFVTTTSGGVGAITRQNGFRATTPIVLNSAGNYDLFLKEAWAGGCVGCEITVLSATATAAKAYNGHLWARAATGSTPKVTIQMKRSDTIAAADVADGASILVILKMKNSA